MLANTLDILVCPACDGMLEKPSSKLTCSACGASYPITSEGIVSFTGDFDPGFDHRWMRHAKPQATTAGVFEMKTGWSSAMLKGKTVLDAGCGCGRFTREALLKGAKVIAVDASIHGLQATLNNAPKELHENLLLVQASLLTLPIKDKSLDGAFSIGVLHHTEDPKASFSNVAATVRPGGDVAIWVYAKPTTDRWLPSMDFLHAITRACPPEMLHAAIEEYALRVRDAYAGEWSPLAQVLRISNSPDKEECISDTFDWHAPKYRYWHTVDEVIQWFSGAGLQVTRVGDFPVSIAGTKL